MNIMRGPDRFKAIQWNHHGGQASRKVTSAWPNQKPALNRAATTGALLFRIRCPMDGSLGLGSGNPMAGLFFWEGRRVLKYCEPNLPLSGPTLHTQLVIKQHWEFPHSQHGAAMCSLCRLPSKKWLGKSWEFPAKELIDGETVLQDAILVGLGSLWHLRRFLKDKDGSVISLTT